MFMPIASFAPPLAKRWPGAPSAIPNPLLRRPAVPRWERVEPLDQGNGFQGMGRSHTFPFREWRDSDEYRTVFFDEGEGHPIVFVHGLGGNATHFEFLLSDLVRTHRVVGLDLVGCGWTEKPDRPYSVNLLKDHLLSFLDRHRIGRATLVGHSLGGAVCMAAALERPGQFESLALLCAAGVAPLPKWMRAAAPLFLRRSVLLPTLGLGADFIVNNVFVDRADDNPHVRWFRDSAMRDGPGFPNLRAFARVCETLCRDVVSGDYSDRLQSLHLPVLGIWGDADKLTCRSSVMHNLARIERVRTVVLRRCGHMPMIERPRETLFHLRRLLDTPPA